MRNLIRAGVPERVAMMISGHRTRSVLDRYNIVDERDLHSAGERLQEYLHRQSEAAKDKSRTSGLLSGPEQQGLEGEKSERKLLN